MVFLDQGREGAAGGCGRAIRQPVAETDAGAEYLFAFLCALSGLSWLRRTAKRSSNWYYPLFFLFLLRGDFSPK